MIALPLHRGELVAAGTAPGLEVGRERGRREQPQRLPGRELLHFAFQPDDRARAGQRAHIERAARNGRRHLRRRNGVFPGGRRNFGMHVFPGQIAAGKIPDPEAVLLQDPLRQIAAQPDLAAHNQLARPVQLAQAAAKLPERNVDRARNRPGLMLRLLADIDDQRIGWN